MKEIIKKYPPVYIYLGVFLFIISAVFLVSALLHPPRIEKHTETIVFLRPQGPLPDVTQSDQGTFIVSLRAAPDDVKVSGAFPDKVQLFSSKLTGLAVFYSPKDQVLLGGKPSLKTEKIDLLDGQMHQIVYTFKVQDKQRIFLDTRLLAEGDYNPNSPSLATGFVIKNPEDIISVTSMNVQFSTVEKALSEEDLFG